MRKVATIAPLIWFTVRWRFRPFPPGWRALVNEARMSKVAFIHRNYVQPLIISAQMMESEISGGRIDGIATLSRRKRRVARSPQSAQIRPRRTQRPENDRQRAEYLPAAEPLE